MRGERCIPGKLGRVEGGNGAEGGTLPEEFAVGVECEGCYCWWKALWARSVGAEGVLGPVCHLA